MDSQILVKVRTFIKNRLLELFGILLILASSFILASIISYSPSDPNFIFSPESEKIENFGGFYGSTIADFLIQSIGLVSILFSITLFFWGLKLFTNGKINNFSLRVFFSFLYIVFIHSFWFYFYKCFLQ